MPGNVKGTLLIARMRYLYAHGAEDSERVLRNLSVDDQTVLKGMLLPGSWYPGDVLLRLENVVAALLARGDRRLLYLDMGRFSAEVNLGPTGVQRPYLREGDPHFLLSHVPRMYTAVHSSGRREYERTGDCSAALRTFDAEETEADDCLTAVGWLQRAIELSGGKDVRVSETLCRAKGATHCEYHCEWR